MLTSIFYSETRRYSQFYQESRRRLIMLLPGAGCQWRKETGGCTMCGFYEANRKITFGRLWPAILFKLIFFFGGKKFAAADEVAVFNGGSFLNKKEIPLKFQDWFFSKIEKYPNIKEVFIESRCEYLEKSRIERIIKLVGGKKLAVGLGLESADDNIRNNLIKKGLSWDFFKEKVKMLKNLGAISSAYIFLKPLGLSEEEALEDVLITLRRALSAGVDRVDISSAFVQDKTPLAAAYRKGEFSPPKLWTVLKIISESRKNNWPVNIGGFSDWPPPLAMPANCGKCSPLIYEAIEKFRQTGILGAIPDCACQNE